MIGQTIAHYRLVSRLGAGGMGEVYLAEDTKLARKVALKILPPATASAEGGKRLVQEARAAAALDHPHICGIHEVGEADGQTFIVMQYIEGENLAQRLARKPMRLTDALDIARQVADAIAEAHARGIVHRDIKPHNIMIDARGHANVLDFGLARTLCDPSISDSGGQTVSVLTSEGAIVGSVPYMSPEQARGEPVDARSDIFSFGAVLYEMLTGVRPFGRLNLTAALSSVLTEDPAPVARYVPDAPGELQRMVRKCLEKERTRRYQSMRDVVVDLDEVKRELSRDAPSTTGRSRRGVVTGLAALGALAVASVVAKPFLSRFASTGSRGPVKSIAVMPLKSVGGQTGDADLGLGIAADIITKVSQLRQLTVRPTSAVRKYATQELSALDAGRELNVDAVLDGTLQRQGDHVRVNVNLLNVRSGGSIWSETFDVDSASIFDIQDRVSKNITSQLRITLSGSESALLAKRPTVSAEAYQYYVKGAEAFDRTGRATAQGTDLQPAISLLKQAIQADPDYALAYAELAYCYAWMAIFVEPQNPAWIQLARETLGAAVARDPRLPRAHVVRGELYWSRYEGFNLEAAIRELRAAQQLDPTAALSQLGVLYAHVGFADASLRALERAIEIDPTSDTPKTRLIEAYVLLGKLEAALAAADRFGRPGQNRTVLALLWTRKYAEAERSIAQGLAGVTAVGASEDGFTLSSRSLLAALKGNLAAADRDLADAARMAQGSRAFHHTAYNIACVHALAGRTREAVDWLQQTAETGMPNLPLFERDPHLDNIRKEPTFRDFMTRLAPRWNRLRREFE